jgi:hypothetical protein
MKKIIFISILLLFYGCDILIDDHFIIENKCSEEISVAVIDLYDKSYNFYIDPQTDTLFLMTGGIPRPKQSKMIQKTFKQIAIIKNEVRGKVNYLDENNWTYRMIDADNCEWYLVVNPKDFE